MQSAAHLYVQSMKETADFMDTSMCNENDPLQTKPNEAYIYKSNQMKPRFTMLMNECKTTVL